MGVEGELLGTDVVAISELLLFTMSRRWITTAFAASALAAYPTFASAARYRRSAASASSNPPPSAYPLIAAMTGLADAKTRSASSPPTSRTPPRTSRRVH